MKSVSLFAFTLAAALSAQAAIERTVEKTFNVTGIGTVHLETNGGGIRVESGSDSVVKITARERIRADSDTEADALLKDLELTFEQTGADVRAEAKYTRSSPAFHFGSWPPVQVEFVASVPAAFAADVHTSGGSITIGDLAGTVNARTSGGAISLGKLGGKVDARTSGGSISLSEARGEAKLDTSGGPISIGRLGGKADVSTSGGSIKIEDVADSVRAHTSGGSIRAAITAVKGECAFSTSGGSVHVTVPKSASFHLDASTSGGGVSAEGITVAAENPTRSRNKLVGDVNGGGPLVKLRSSGGGLTVEAH